ncbi:class I SAM-dependent methyltransferase [Myxococcus sp. CA039A]|uniref:class I SAM-dependent methyltransferase n=1 Tax=Myxococcus sp. CA039A TaxID=2741737 RepID=UPI00359C4344
MNPGVELSQQVSSLAMRFQGFLRMEPSAANAGILAWLQEVETLGAMLTNGAAARLGPHAASVDNLRSSVHAALGRLLDFKWASPEVKAAARGYMERNPALRQVGRYRFSTDWMSKCEAEWREVLSPLMGQPGARVLEIGSFEGRSAIWLLENVLTHPTSRITCVDLFEGNAARLFDENIATSGAGERVEKRVGLSHVALRRLPPEPVYDFIYVDGSHETYDVLEDAVLCWRLLKPGGVMTFDDYGMAAAQLADFQDISRPDLGIDAFLSAAARHLQVVRKAFQVTVRKNPA